MWLCHRDGLGFSCSRLQCRGCGHRERAWRSLSSSSLWSPGSCLELTPAEIPVEHELDPGALGSLPSGGFIVYSTFHLIPASAGRGTGTPVTTAVQTAVQTQLLVCSTAGACRYRNGVSVQWNISFQWSSTPSPSPALVLPPSPLIHASFQTTPIPLPNASGEGDLLKQGLNIPLPVSFGWFIMMEGTSLEPARI